MPIRNVNLKLETMTIVIVKLGLFLRVEISEGISTDIKFPFTNDESNLYKNL